jgi:hypothetical protein
MGYSYTQIEAAQPIRAKSLEDARQQLVLARKLSLHSPPIRDEIGRLIEGIDECLSRLGP